MSERRILRHQVIEELRQLEAFEPSADMDIVWVLSNPGTVYKPSQDGVYKGDMADLRAVERGIEVAGPILYYNGEDESTTNVNYPQNQDLMKMVSQPDSPIPKSKVVIGHIDRIGTPAQVEDFARYLEESSISGKIPVVTSAEHSARVSRYLNHYKELLPPDVTFVNAFFPETFNSVGKTKREISKIIEYAEKGDLSREPLDNF